MISHSDPYLKISLLEQKVKELEEQTGKRATQYQDGSTRRHINRTDCQKALIGLLVAYDESDHAFAFECWDELKNEAEKVHVWNFLTVKQRDFIREAQHYHGEARTKT